MDPGNILPWLSLFLSASTVAGLLYGWFSAPGTKALAEAAKAKADIAALKETLGDEERERDAIVVARFTLLEGRVQTIEGELKHLPDRDQAHRMELAIEKLSGRVDVLAKGIEPVSAIADRWQELILEQAKK